MEDIDYTRLLNIMDPPEPVEIIAQVSVARYSLYDEQTIKHALCEEIVKQIMRKELIEIKSVDSPLENTIIFYGKIKLHEHKYKLKLLI
jgi:hypothetical protein